MQAMYEKQSAVVLVCIGKEDAMGGWTTMAGWMTSAVSDKVGRSEGTMDG